MPLLADTDATIAVAAASTLGWIGDEAATTALSGVQNSQVPEIKTAVSAALVRCAEQRLSQGNASEAAALYRKLLDAAPTPAIRSAAWRGLALSDGEHRTELVLGALTGGDKQLRLVAVKLMRETNNDQTLKACLQQWKSLGADAQMLLVNVLADRGDRAFLASALEACQSPEKSVRVAGIRAVGVLGDATNITLLVERAARTSALSRRRA